MPSDLIQTSSNLFQNMLLQHVWFYLLKLAKHSSLSQKKWSTKPNHIRLNHVKISLLSIPKKQRERGEKHELGLMGLLCFNLEWKRASQQVHTKHIHLLFTVTRYYVPIHIQNRSTFLYSVLICEDISRGKLLLDPFQVSIWFRYWDALSCPC